MDDASIAVALTCFNEGDYIGAAVRSVLDQTAARHIAEIIIADDGSNPETLATLRNIQTWDSRITVLYGSGGVGVPAQRNLCFRNSTAPIVALLDGDDLWAAEKLETQLPILLNDDTVGLVYSGYYTFPAHDLKAARPSSVTDLSRCPDQTVAYFLNDPPIIPSTMLMRRAALEACGGFAPDIRVFEDTDFCIRMSKVCRFAFCPEPLLYKRFHAASATGGARNDLLAHHAFVAFKAAQTEPRLMKHVPHRLAERARKLGNQCYLMNDRAQARLLLSVAIRLEPTNVRAWISLLSVRLGGEWLNRLLASRLRARRSALGIASDP